jgi:hypothetical protein
VISADMGEVVEYNYIQALCENLHRMNKLIRQDADGLEDAYADKWQERLRSNLYDTANHSDTIIQQIEEHNERTR